MSARRESLLAVIGFLPYVVILFLNAFVDLGHKIIIQNIVFKVYDGSFQVVLTSVVNGLILLPFILLFSPAGFSSDRWPKNKIMRLSAWCAVLLTLLISAFYYFGWFWQAFAMTFLLAAQSAFYSPAKYGYIRELVGKPRLASANGVVQATTIIAILLGTFVFSALFEWYYQPVQTALLPQVSQPAYIISKLLPLGCLLVMLSVVELILSYRLPQLESARPEQQFSLINYFTGRDIVAAVKPLFATPVIPLAVLGLAAFWSVSQVMLAAFPAFIKQSLAETNTVYIQGVMAVTGLGILCGSLLSARLLKKASEQQALSVTWLPLPALAISLCLFWLPLLPNLWLHSANFFVIGLFGGLYIVPLNTLIQFYGESRHLGKILAANNLLQNIAMLSFLLLTALFAWLGIGVQYLLLLIALIALCGCGYSALAIRRLG
ncbi:MAG: acyl-[acyl-carrier-protein]-phospholipid O-acyltransferase [Oceanicoccus sp.]